MPQRRSVARRLAACAHRHVIARLPPRRPLLRRRRCPRPAARRRAARARRRLQHRQRLRHPRARAALQRRMKPAAAAVRPPRPLPPWRGPRRRRRSARGRQQPRRASATQAQAQTTRREAAALWRGRHVSCASGAAGMSPRARTSRAPATTAKAALRRPPWSSAAQSASSASATAAKPGSVSMSPVGADQVPMCAGRAQRQLAPQAGLAWRRGRNSALPSSVRCVAASR